MDQRSHTGMPRAALPRSDSTVDVVFWIAFVVSALFAIAQVAFAIAFVPVMLYAFETAELATPFALTVADRLGPFGIVVVLSVCDIATFALFALVARKYWTGLLFIPPLIYMLATFALFVSGISGAAVILAR